MSRSPRSARAARFSRLAGGEPRPVRGPDSRRPLAARTGRVASPSPRATSRTRRISTGARRSSTRTISDTVLLLAAFPTRRPPPSPGPGSATAARSSSTNDTASLYAARTWWSLRAYGLGVGPHPRRRLPTRWVASGRPISPRRASAGSGRVRPARPAAGAPDDERPPIARRVLRRGDSRRPGAPRVPGIRGERPAPGPRAGSRHLPVGPHDRAGQRPASRTATRSGPSRIGAGVGRPTVVLLRPRRASGPAKLAFVLA